MCLQVSTNGFISVQDQETNFVPRPFPTTGRIIAPLWGDADTSNGAGTIMYSTNTDSATLVMVQQSIAAAFPDQSAFSPIYAFIITWDRIWTHRHGKRLWTTGPCSL